MDLGGRAPGDEVALVHQAPHHAKRVVQAALRLGERLGVVGFWDLKMGIGSFEI